MGELGRLLELFLRKGVLLLLLALLLAEVLGSGRREVVVVVFFLGRAKELGLVLLDGRDGRLQLFLLPTLLSTVRLEFVVLETLGLLLDVTLQVAQEESTTLF